jgi:Protein of unknown function (DUF3892)
MASKWADYVVTAVRFNTAGTHIEELRVFEDTGDELTNQTTKTRSSVALQIDNGYTYCTATKGSDGKFVRGADVKVVTIEGEKFLKTKADGRKEDNLDNLPTF